MKKSLLTILSLFFLISALASTLSEDQMLTLFTENGIQYQAKRVFRADCDYTVNLKTTGGGSFLEIESKSTCTDFSEKMIAIHWQMNTWSSKPGFLSTTGKGFSIFNIAENDISEVQIMIYAKNDKVRLRTTSCSFK